MISADDFYSTSLIAAAAEGDTRRVEQLLKYSPHLLNQPNPSGVTPLMVAAERGHVSVIRDLVASGAELEANSNTSGTALISAVGHPEIVQVLISAGANVNCRTGDGSTALMYAVISGSVEVVQCLLGAGADPNAKNQLGYSALDLAENRSYSSFKALLRNILRPNQRYYKIAQLLRQAGARK